ncbi:MAG: AAC(3) family N-acetyltransferase [Anaerolineae bacterium]|jgi:aminoglycoside N3'-acetyltransferase
MSAPREPEEINAAMVTIEDIRKAIQNLSLSNKPVCIHASLRSFGWVKGGPLAVVNGFLAQGCTVVVPTFSYDMAVSPPVDMRPPQNGYDYDTIEEPSLGSKRIYTPKSTAFSREYMGAVPAAVLAMPRHVRGDHPLNSFAAVGPLAHRVISSQGPMNVYGPLKVLAETDGSVMMIGVELNRMTLLHLAEQLAGRNLFRRWANGPDGQPMQVEVGSCSEGFGNLGPVLAQVMAEVKVGKSTWRVYPAKETLTISAREIQANPSLTHCGDTNCLRCQDAVLGGPILDDCS